MRYYNQALLPIEWVNFSWFPNSVLGTQLGEKLRFEVLGGAEKCLNHDFPDYRITGIG